MTSEEELATQALDELPQRRPASLYDIAVQYSVLDWYETISSGDLDFELDPEHLAFMTPKAKADLYNEADNAIVVYVDLRDPEDPELRSERPVRIETVTEDDRFRLGHSYPTNKTSSMTDYSVTTHKSADAHHLAGKRDDAWGTANVQDRFTRWAQSDAAQEVADDDTVEDKWILDTLASLGEDQAVIEQVQSEFLELVDHDEEREFDAFVTIRVRLPGEDRYRWPGEVPALNEVMVRQKAERFENMSVENAGGDGSGYVSGEETRVKGGSAGLLGMYSKKQREHFPDISPSGSQAWRSRPVTRETAAALSTANSVFEEFYQGLGNSRRLYVLPYLGTHPDSLSPNDVSWFVESVFTRLRESEGAFQDEIETVFYERDTDDDDLGLAGVDSSVIDDTYDLVRVATAFTVSGNPDRVFFEERNTDKYRPRELDLDHAEVLRSREFASDNGIFEQVVERSDSPLLSDSNRTGMILFGRYFEWTTEPTQNSQEASDTPKAGDIDDVRARRLRQFITDETIATEPLFEEYLNRIVQTQRDRFEDDGSGVPTREIVEQYVQLRALQRNGLLNTTDPNVTQPVTIATVTDSTHPDPESREERLEDFIDRHDVLQESNPKQAVFLLGGLVGRISAYQRNEGVSSTLVRRYPIDYLTKQSIKEVTNEVLQMNNTYVESDEQLPSTYNARYIDRLPDLMLASDPSNWTFAQNELQWLYGLGIAYGTSDTQIDTNNE